MHEQDGDGEPAHHARRPMNAFLIFCKRHRSVVRAKYPNLENRSITKILGEWWANLDEEEKACYTDLAKQYKDAFFSANPDFKWYKLPAPPLRTLSSRPREPTDKHLESSNNEYHQEVEKTNNNSTKYDFNKKSIDNDSEADVKPVSMFTPGKLADEAQMGGLSSLLAIKTEIQTPNPYYSPPTFKFNPNSTSIEYRSHNLIDRPKSIREHSINELQNALSETTKMFEEDFDEKEGLYHYVANDQFTNQDVIDQIVDKRYYKDEEGYQRNWSDDEKNRSDRTCKGKRYQEFMAVGGLIVNKRQRRDCPERLSDEGYNASCSCDPGSSREESTVFDDSKNCFMDMAAEIEIKTEQNDAPEPDNNGNKTFKAADFDLEAKIEALPSLSLEKYQERKREGKRKKKSTLEKPKRTDLNQRESSNHRESSHRRQSFNQTESTNQIINSVPCRMSDERRELAERWRNNVIGSQKRKPRKISITRIETNSRGISSATNCHPALSSTVTANCIASNSANTTNCLAVTNSSNGTMKGENKRSPEFKIATEAPCTVAQSMEACQASHSVDLLALATLAEVASNTSKIEDTTDVTAKASEDNASKV